jgi:hypothetical protein
MVFEASKGEPVENASPLERELAVGVGVCVAGKHTYARSIVLHKDRAAATPNPSGFGEEDRSSSRVRGRHN